MRLGKPFGEALVKSNAAAARVADLLRSSHKGQAGSYTLDDGRRIAVAAYLRGRRDVAGDSEEQAQAECLRLRAELLGPFNPKRATSGWLGRVSAGVAPREGK